MTGTTGNTAFHNFQFLVLVEAVLTGVYITWSSCLKLLIRTIHCSRCLAETVCQMVHLLVRPYRSPPFFRDGSLFASSETTKILVICWSHHLEQPYMSPVCFMWNSWDLESHPPCRYRLLYVLYRTAISISTSTCYFVPEQLYPPPCHGGLLFLSPGKSCTSLLLVRTVCCSCP